MGNSILFFIYWLVNYLVIYLFSLLFPNMIVLGSFRLPAIPSAIYSGFWLTFVVWCLWEYMFVRNVDFDTDEFKNLYSLFVNILGIWLISRYSEYTGLGIVSIGWVFVLATVAMIVQKIINEKIYRKDN